MTRDDIIKLAAEVWNTGSFYPIPSSDDILRFAALVAVAEREACAQVCEEEICNCCWDDDARAAAEHLAAAIRARGNT